MWPVGEKEALQDLINRRDPNVVGLCEAHLNKEVTAPIIDGYRWFGNNGTGGSCGVGLYLKEEIRQ